MSSMKSFCWIRTLALDAQATEPKEAQVVQPCQANLQPFAGWRPPLTMASIPASAEASCAEREGGNTKESEGYQFWIAPENQFGRVQADTVFDYGPAFDSEEDAQCWITSVGGQLWAKQASNRVLVGFGVCTETRRIPSYPEHLPGIDNCKNTPEGYRFEDKHWGRDASFAHKPRRNPSDLLLSSLDSLVCPKIHHECTADELQALVRLQHALRSQNEAAIRQQAQSMRHAIAPVLDAAGLAHTFFDTAAGQELVAWVADTVEPVIFLNKRYFMRKRPGHFRDPNLKPLFGDTGAGLDRLHPGHPSYPSGHATHAYVWAYLLQRCGAKPDAVLGAASAVAVNREIAGLHFASDTAAGQGLAEEIVKRMADVQHNANYADFVKQLNAIGLQLRP